MELFFGFFKTNAATITAVCALFMTIWQLHVQRKHNRISVKPHLIRHVDSILDGGVASRCVSIKNNGLGPAFIKEFTVYLDGKEIDVDDAIKQVFGGLKVKLQYGTMNEDAALAANEDKVILKVEFESKSQDYETDMDDRLDRLDLFISYESAYGEKCFLDSRE